MYLEIRCRSHGTEAPLRHQLPSSGTTEIFLLSTRPLHNPPTQNLLLLLAKLASFHLIRGLSRKAFCGNIVPSIRRSSTISARPLSKNKPTERRHSARSLPVRKPHVRPPPARKSIPSSTPVRNVGTYRSKHQPEPLKSGSYVFRTPKLLPHRAGFQTPRATHLIYHPSTYEFAGFEFPPVTGITPMKINYQVVTTPTYDTPGTCLILNFPDKRYVFGQVSEGTQRACMERGVRLAYLTDVFITGRSEWKSHGGLIGMILTVSDVVGTSQSALETSEREKAERKAQNDKGTIHGLPMAIKGGETVLQRGSLTLHGPRNLTHTLTTGRRFVFRKGMPIFTREYDTESVSKNVSVDAEDPFEQPTWSDNNIKVWALPIRPSSPSPQGSPQSPRKRSLDEFQEQDSDELDSRAKDLITKQAIVNDMFNSSWRMDALVKTPLAEVNMPAAMFVRNVETKSFDLYKGPMPGGDEPLPDINVFVRQPWPGAAVERIPSTSRCDEALSYIVRNHDFRGKFDPAKAKAYGIPYGPTFGKLAGGESVTVGDTVITPDMVLGPPRLGKGIAFIDLPTPDYIENLVNRPEWNSPSVTTNLEAFVWILGPGLGEHPKLREFMSRMSHCKHTVSSTDYNPNYLALAGVASGSVRMARIRRENHPIPIHDNVTLPQPGTSTAKSTTTAEIKKTLPFKPLEPGLIIELEPETKINSSLVAPRFNADEVMRKMPEAVEKRVATINKRVKKYYFQKQLSDFQRDLPGRDAEIFTLGTGSSVPSRYRNVSSTLVSVPGYGYYLLDCGENTLGQLKRVFEPEKLREVLQNLRVVWISHLHADHHLGTAAVIQAWYKENYPNGAPETDELETDMAKILKEKRLFVVSEPMMIGWLQEYASVEDYGFGKIVPLTTYTFTREGGDGSFESRLAYRHCRADGTYPGHDTDEGKPKTSSLSFNEEKSSLAPLLRKATGLSELLTTRVSHCKGAMAATLVFPDGFKVSFSGDCRPSPAFAAIGRGSTVMIHEATFQNDMAGSALAKKHCTAAEALEVGRRMKAKSIILTHFSQRYQKVTHVERTDSRPTDEPEEPAGQEPDQLDIPDDEEPAFIPGSMPPIMFEDNFMAQAKPVDVPVVGAFDYMRIRVGEMPLTQAYAPAIEKLNEILERMSGQEQEENKKMLEKQAAEIMKQKMEKHAKPGKLGKKAKKASFKANAEANDATPEPEPAPPTPAPKADEKPQSKHSIWSASESESGWDTSDYEELDLEPVTPRKQSPPKNYSPPMTRSRSKSQKSN
ncbi:ribonuclease Z [Aspergillus affinis]|uniref:ribonuclease Z n=1 Tax=Aspergillus affinis TaxID=1070780 RepID=UPI0022FEE603|nr:uncharacterized protein KD926_002406 [Aspergillus affinis]KAI9044026.1 hypothetical protein KD926_002406 [Aspergillus affinis]